MPESCFDQNTNVTVVQVYHDAEKVKKNHSVSLISLICRMLALAISQVVTGNVDLLSMLFEALSKVGLLPF